jgi:adenylate cyclase
VPVSADDAGVRRRLCLLLVRIRDVDAIARDRQPYDLVFLLNEFFAATGQAIEDNFGRIDRFLGDGVLAVFGEQRGLDSGCRDALLAARAIDLALDRVNEKLAAEIGRPVQACIGISAGDVVQGRIAIGRSSRVAVVGFGVDLPERLAEIAAQKGWQLAMSVDAAERAGVIDLGVLDRATLGADGDTASAVDLVGVTRGRDLAIEPIEPAAS